MRNSTAYNSDINNFSKFEDRINDGTNFLGASMLQLSKLLVTAASEGKHREVSKLIAEGASFQHFGPVGMNPLHWASMNGHLKTCRILVNSGVLINTKNKVGRTALHLAAVNGHTHIVHHLISSGATIDVCDMLDMTPLHWACDRGHSQVASLLLLNGADPNRFNKFHKSPKLLASENGHLEIVNLMKLKYPDSEKFFENSKTSIDISSSDLDTSSSLNGMEEADVSTDSIFSEELTPQVSNEEVVEAEGIENIENEIQNMLNEESNHSETCKMDEESLIQDNLLKSVNQLQASSSFQNCEDNELNDIEHAATELLRAQAALGSLEDPCRILKRAVSLGQTIKLTEAGEKALSMIRPEPFITPDESQLERKKRENNAAHSQSKPECNAIAIRNKSMTELFNELIESCSSNTFAVKSDLPPTKRYKR